MKLISNAEMLKWCRENKIVGFLDAYAKQAQLESCEKEHTEGVEQLIKDDADRCAGYMDVLRDEHTKVVGEIFEEIEKRSHPMNTNMYGISLSKDDWLILKQKYEGRGY